jgi:hypothetical protein
MQNTDEKDIMAIIQGNGHHRRSLDTGDLSMSLGFLALECSAVPVVQDVTPKIHALL